MASAEINFERFNEFLLKSQEGFSLKEMGIASESDLEPFLAGSRFLDPNRFMAFYYWEASEEKDRPFSSHAFVEVTDEIDYCRMDKMLDRAMYETKLLKRLGSTIQKVKVESGLNFLNSALSKNNPEKQRGEYYDENHHLLVRIQEALIRWIKELERLKEYVTGIEEPAPFITIEEGGHMSAFQIALRHWFLEEAKEIPYINGKAFVETYGRAKIEGFVNEIRKNFASNHQYQRRNLLNDLRIVKLSLSDFPDIQISVENRIKLIE